MRELKKGILPEGTEMGSIGGVDVKQFASKDGTAIQLTGSKGYVQLSREDAAKLAARLAKWAGSKTSAQPGEYESVQESDCGCGPDCACGGNCGPDCNCQNCGESTTEAVGSFADPIYDLIEELGSHSIVLDELIRYLDGDTIKDFVSDFRRHNDMPEMKDDADESVTEAEGHKVINHNNPVHLAGDSIWQGKDRDEEVTDTVNVGKISINKDEDGYVSVSVDHDGPWTIYTDTGFEDAISEIIGMDVGWSEQGMQEKGTAHLEADYGEENESIKRKERTMEEIDRILQIAGIQKAPVAVEEDKDTGWVTPEGGPLSYKKVGEYTYIVKDENGKEHKAEMGAMGDEQDNYSGDEVEKTMDQEGLAMLIRQAKMGAPVKEAEPMGDVPKFACINIDTGEYGYCHKNELHKYTHYIPADEFTYFDPGSGINYADFDDQMADQEGWKKIPTKQSAGDFKSPEGGPLSYKRVGEYTYIVKDENGKEHKAEAGATDDTQDKYSGDEVEKSMDQEGLAMLIRQAKMGAPVKEAEPMGDVPKFACINIDTGEYGYCHKNELHKYTHYIPADEFTYFDPGSGINYADFDDQMADQEGWKKIPTKQSAGDFKSPEGGPLSYKRVGEYTYIVKDENGKEHKAEAGATDDTQDNYSGDEVEQTMDQKGLEMLIRQAKMGAPVKEAKKELDEEPNEGNEFSGELAKAKKAGKKEFEVDGKKYKVESEEADEEVVAEAPTMDTTQLINLLKNSGISEEQINKKLDEWANTPAGVGEVEPTVHAGDANDDFAQAVNLSLKRYLDAQDMKVNVTESHTKEKLSNAYKDFKAK